MRLEKPSSHGLMFAAVWITFADFWLISYHQKPDQAQLNRRIQQLQTQLNEALENLEDAHAKVNDLDVAVKKLKGEKQQALNRIKDLKDDVGRLESERTSLLGMIDDLNRRIRLLEDTTVLLTEYESLRLENERLLADLAELRKITPHRDMPTHEELLQLLDKTGEAIVALTARNHALEAAIAGLSNRIVEVTDQVDAATEDMEALKAEITRLENENRILKEENERLRKLLADSEKGQGNIRKELIGLKGGLGRVAFLFDHSASMNDDPQRWQAALRIVEVWLENLGVRECRIIAFNQDVEVFPPANGAMVVLRDEKGNELEDAPAKRKAALDWLKQKKPEGQTNTLGALEEAYKIKDLEMIVLFTDGVPKTFLTPRDAKIDAPMRDAIYALCPTQQGPDPENEGRLKTIPVNAIGLGEYYKDAEFARFLLDLTKKTGGTFLGR